MRPNHPDRSRGDIPRTSIRCWRGVHSALSFYPPELVQTAHEHDQAHVSVLLAGGFEEGVGGHEIERFAGSAVRRDAGCRHRVRFGGTGALVFSAEQGHGADDAALSAIGVCRAPMDTVVAPPDWLSAAKDWLMDDPGGTTVDRLAEACGVHRVHFSRVFKVHFGVRPSAFRTRSMVGHALMLTLTEGLPLVEAALAAGFADQAHLSRAVKASCGAPLGVLRSKLTPA